MAGPAATVLLRIPMTEALKQQIRSDIRSMSHTVEGDDFWIRKRPFILIVDRPEPLEGDLSSHIGWTPAGQIGLAAMCNDSLDHRLLGELCLHFARAFDGWIDFGGALLTPHRSGEPGMPGRLFEIPYITGLGKEWVYHVSDADFLEAWLRHPGFHMVK